MLAYHCDLDHLIGNPPPNAGILLNMDTLIKDGSFHHGAALDHTIGGNDRLAHHSDVLPIEGRSFRTQRESA